MSLSVSPLIWCVVMFEGYNVSWVSLQASEEVLSYRFVVSNSQIGRRRDIAIPIPPNYTCMAVVATIFFFPVGVFAIVYAIKVLCVFYIIVVVVAQCTI